MSDRNDTWAEGDAYEPFVGRWSRPVARDFVDWLEVSPGADWLDAGCGTGALTEAILRQAQPTTVTGIDLSADYVAHARRSVRDPRVSFGVADAMALPFPDAHFDAVVSALALNFVPDPDAALAEMARVVRPGGTVAAYVWDYQGGMRMLRVFWDAAVALDPLAAERDEGRRFPICRPEPLADLFRQAGLVRIEARAIDTATRFRDFDDYWSPFLGGQGPAPGYVVSLSEEKRSALRERIRSRLPVAPDGSISLGARAWAIQGNRPSPQAPGGSL